MERTLRRWVASALAAFCLALFATMTPVAAASPQSQSQALASTPFKGTVINYANVRSGPTTHDRILAVDRPGTTVTVYAQVTGQAVWAGNVWDRITPTSASPRYIYSALVQGPSSGGSGGGTPPAPSSKGKLILVSISKQWLWAYQDGKAVFNTPVTTAMPGLVTPLGTWHIFNHLHPTTFYSPWPPGSPYYYPPTHINYAMGWHSGGYFIHDSYWRSVYGPGTNVWHHDPVDGWMSGTHGCITAPLKAIIWLYYWAPNGTTVKVVR
jgi:lipoprotein-anchoring transpeptidase ErfK/SrfK